MKFSQIQVQYLATVKKYIIEFSKLLSKIAIFLITTNNLEAYTHFVQFKKNYYNHNKRLENIICKTDKRLH